MADEKTAYERLVEQVLAVRVPHREPDEPSTPSLASHYATNMERLRATLETGDRKDVRWLDVPSPDAMHIECKPDGTEVYHPPLPEAPKS